MSIYSELLKAALGGPDVDKFALLSDSDLVGEWLVCRRAIEISRASVSTDRPPAVARVADLLTCDILLVEISRRLGVEEHLVDAGAGPCERERVEQAVDAALVTA